MDRSLILQDMRLSAKADFVSISKLVTKSNNFITTFDSKMPGYPPGI